MDPATLSILQKILRKGLRNITKSSRCIYINIETSIQKAEDDKEEYEHVTG